MTSIARRPKGPEWRPLRRAARAATVDEMSSQRGAPGDPRNARPESVATEGTRSAAESPTRTASGATSTPLALRWDGVSPPPAPAPPADEARCHACDATIDGEPAGHGLLLFVRGDAIEREEPPLCEACGLAIGMTALWNFLDEEEG